MDDVKHSKKERGATLLEYAVLVSMIAMVALISVRTFGESLLIQITESTDAIVDAGGAGYH